MAKKTFSKRFKVTKTGKITHRKMGLSHFKSKKSSKLIRNKRSLIPMSVTNKKQIIAEL